jgi:hypothetical protein
MTNVLGETFLVPGVLARELAGAWMSLPADAVSAALDPPSGLFEA